MDFRIRPVLCGIAVAAVTVGQPPVAAMATPVAEVEGSIGVGTPQGAINLTYGIGPGSDTSNASISDSLSGSATVIATYLNYMTSEAASSASATYGVLRASASTGTGIDLSAATPYDIGALFGDATGATGSPEPYGNGTNSVAISYFQDSLNFSGAPAETPVELSIGLSLNVKISGNGVCQIGNSTAEAASLNFDEGAAILSDYGCNPKGYQQEYLDTVGYVGSPFFLFPELGISSEPAIPSDLWDEYGSSSLPFAKLSIQSIFDASDTADLSVQILTPSITYTSDSGTVYATTLPTEPVPEPDTFSLLASGIVAAFLLTRRRPALDC